MIRKKSLRPIDPHELRRDPFHPLRLRWRAKFLRLLGRMADAKLARKMGVSLDAVKGERRRRGIEPFRPRRPPVQWSSKMIRLLGTDIDSEVGERLGLPVYLVRHKRQRLGIPPYGDVPEQHNPRAFNWTKSKIALLGTDSDQKIAERLGTNLAVVTRQRTLSGIPSLYRRRRISWTKEMAALLGNITDWKIARKYKIDQASVARERHKRGIPPFVENRPVTRSPKLRRILSLPIRLISHRYKISSETVARLRRDLGVPPLERWPSNEKKSGRESFRGMHKT